MYSMKSDCDIVHIETGLNDNNLVNKSLACLKNSKDELNKF